MIANITKLLGAESTVTGATTLSRATLVRVYNQTAGDVVVTIVTDDTSPITLTATVKGGTVEYFKKSPDSTIAAAAGLKMVAVGV